VEKLFKSLDEQIDILRNKGLIIEDEDFAREVLLRENYFFINGYRVLLMNSYSDKTFVVGSTFRELYSIFLFDRAFRNILFKNLLIVENQLKSVISYQLSKKYGYKDKDYLNPKNFTGDRLKNRRVKDVVEKMKRQVRVNGVHHMATMHYMNNYGYIPLWVLVKVLSFGIVCELYYILKPEDQVTIADIFGISTQYLENFLPILANYRNLCAHEDIVFDHKTERTIPDTEYHKKLNIFKMDDEYIYGKNDLFAVIIIFKMMLEDSEFRLMLKEFEYELEKLDGRVDSIPVEKILDTMGVPKNYMDIIDM
jgi:abortive infection bacteriophage resistance protein